MMSLLEKENENTGTLTTNNVNDAYFADLYLLRNEDPSSISFTSISTVTNDIEFVEDARLAFENDNVIEFNTASSQLTDDMIQIRNHYVTNNILNGYAIIGLLSESDSLELSNIAYQNPLEAGESVYTSRVLLGIHNSSIMGIENEKSINDVSSQDALPIVYPNPTEDIVTIKMTYASDWDVELYTLEGKVVFSECFYDAQLLNCINIVELPSGLYQMTMTDKWTNKKYSVIIRKQ